MKNVLYMRKTGYFQRSSPEWEGFKEGDVVGHDLLVGEIKLVHDNGVHVIVGQQVVNTCLIPERLKV